MISATKVSPKVVSVRYLSSDLVEGLIKINLVEGGVVKRDIVDGELHECDLAEGNPVTSNVIGG